MINNFSFKNLISKKLTSFKLNKKLSIIFDNEIEKIFKDVENTKNFYSILSDKYIFNFQIKDLRRFQKFNSIVIIGMGGSILGAEAIYEFLSYKIKKKFYFINNINEDSILNIKKEINLKKTLFLIISKSGNTIETISNSFFLNMIKKKLKKYNLYF